MYRSLGSLSTVLADVPLPVDFFSPEDLPDFLDQIYVLDYRSHRSELGSSTTFWLAFEGELSIGLFGLDGVKLVVGGGVPGYTFVTATFMESENESSLTLHNLSLALRFGSDVLKPADRGEGQPATQPAEIKIEGTIQINSSLNITASNVKVTIDVDGLLDDRGIEVTSFHLDKKCFAITWSESNINHWLRQLAPNLFDEGVSVASEMGLRILFGKPVKEIRLDWAISGKPRTFVIPGLKITTPDAVRLSVLLQATNGAERLNRLAFVLTQEADKVLTATSNFAWGRGEDRELQNDEKKPAAELFKLTAKTKQEVSLLLLNFRLDEAKLPKFFKQLKAPLKPLHSLNTAELYKLSDFENSDSLNPKAWDIDFEFNSDLFEFPFLKQKKQKDSPDGEQFIEVSKPKDFKPKLDFDNTSLGFPLDVKITIGDIKLLTQLDIKFNWEKFALDVDHEKGIKLVSSKPQIPETDPEYLGLKWRFKGTQITEDGPTKGQYHFFTLVTKDYNYQLQQAPDAVFEVDYTRVSDEPIRFTVSDFVLSSKGISLTAAVTDRPAKLNGLDTRFRFHGSRLEIKENRINDFTLAGSGPLPPALVGDAMADIALQFSQRNGNLTLVAGSAKLQSKKLNCRGTRFQFSVDALGLKFVNDGKFHLYFLITGSAQFKLSGSDDKDGALSLLQKVKIDLVECPLTGDTSVLGKHIKFVIELPKPKSFNFLGCFEMELRAIGFIPQAEEFGGDGGMQITGKLKFAQGAGDTPDSRADYHTLLIGLPKKGDFFPRIHFKNLPVNLNLGAAFKLNGVVNFKDSPQEKGFDGEGVLQIQGMPTIAASFAFLRVRKDESSPWVRAWFIYIEARQVSFRIPVVELYLREIGLGFGYRFTLVSIKAADQANDVRALIKELKVLSRTQGDLSKRDRWSIDLEEQGQDPRWTIVLRALISQMSASPSPLQWNESAESTIPCLFLFDAVIAFRSDLTFFMAVRGWINTNYYDYVKDAQKLREKPLFSGFVLLSPRQKRFLAHLASNPQGHLGSRPELPEFIQSAIRNGQFSATLLIEPGLVHQELGWPNMLRWGTKIGPLDAEVRGGFIFRVTKRELVLGSSYLARAKLDLKAEFDFGIVGGRISAFANVAYGARLMGVLDLKNPTSNSAIYGAIGLEINIRFSIEFWIRIKLIFKTISLSFRLSLNISFTAGLEIGLTGLTSVGVRGFGTVSVSVMGHNLHLSIKLGANESVVQNALKRTEQYLQVGLEATDVESVPGIGSSQQAKTFMAPQRGVRAASMAAGVHPVRRITALRADDAMAFGDRSSLLEELKIEGFKAPNYSIFVIRKPKAEEWSYFILLPQGESDSDEVSQEQGFLPVPPKDGLQVENDFILQIPALDDGNCELEQFRFDQGSPKSGNGVWTAHNLSNTSSTSILWKVNWDVDITEAGASYNADGTIASNESEPLSLKWYLRHAFKTDEQENPIGDPNPLPTAETVEDERVHNPTDNSFEAAVRGAFAQFRSSPFFKRDPNSEYEQVLDQAFQDDTTIYSPDGQLPKEIDPNSEELRLIQENQQAQQLRGMVIQDLVADLRDYALASEQEQGNLNRTMVPKSIAFQMGLVFRFKGNPPRWLQDNGGTIPTISQRIGPDKPAPATEEENFRAVRTFNTVKTLETNFSTNFAENPPQFQRVQQFTDANTIAITWDLTWEERAPEWFSPSQREPEHHLLNYQVRRRALDGSERDVVYTLKSAQALHRDKNDKGDSLLKCLKPRFQVVDHFTQETLEDLAELPETGRSYLYTITPIDFAGNLGRPLTLVATRYPNEPPQVPVDGELIVRYRLTPEELESASSPTQGTPQLVKPDQLQVEWTEPAPFKQGPKIPVAKYLLVFRKDTTLPIGSYGLDSATQGPRSKSLPTTNARQLPTDIQIELESSGPRNARTATISLETLQAKGIFPAGNNPEWRPESWRIFFQTVSANGVPSALAPVQLLLRVEAKPKEALAADLLLNEREERRPAELEWLPYPLRFPMLPPEDQRAIASLAHFPMPMLDSSNHAPKFAVNDEPINLDQAISYQPHPAGIRCIRFRWNQGPSNAPNYPLDLNAAYQLFQLDIDAHTTQTFSEPDKLGEALQMLQEIQMLPAEDLLLAPADTLTTNQWEAWYPSTILRRKPPEKRAEGSEIALGPWYSWRESILKWPEWPGLTQANNGVIGQRLQALHPFLQRVIDVLEETHNIDLQTSPPSQPGSFAGFMKVTTAKTDPYGWGILQRLGLAVTFSLHNEKTGDVVQGQESLNALQEALKICSADANWAELSRHLHVELLFQPSRSIQLEPGATQAKDLLAIIQLSLRPIAVQYLKYAKVAIAGTAGSTIELVFNIKAGAPCSVINQADPASGQVELKPEPNQTTTAVKRTIKLPLNGQTTLLLRSKDLPEIGIALKKVPKPLDFPPGFIEYTEQPVPQLIVRKSLQDLTQDQRQQLKKALDTDDQAIANFTIAPAQSFAVTDELSMYFTVPETLAEDFSSSSINTNAQEEWRKFKRYTEVLNSSDPNDEKIIIPDGQKDTITPMLPEFLSWSQRFFDAGGEVDQSGSLGISAPGPWLVTAYPRSGSPAYATPDASGRLTYDHLLEDKWAHNYRYYIKPSGRYDLLWQSFQQSPVLFPDTVKKQPDVLPDPQAGGLDVVLDRTHPVAAPLVLSSSRLDEPSQPGQPVAPGTTWEVIVAQHPEQTLIERNQTLARQLSFRQVAFTLMRRFADPNWIDQLEKALQNQKSSYTHKLQLKFIENQLPALPSAYPAQPDHIALPAPGQSDAKLEDNIALSLDLPQRIGDFQQGALVLQWEAMPFYYEHRLLLVAQTTSQVSSISEVIQRDFEYRSPQPMAVNEAVQKNWQPPLPYGEETGTASISIRLRQVEIPLQRLWDCLPDVVKQQWPQEAPDPKDSTEPKRKLASLPDPDVVYQIVETFSGNIEVQAEFFFDRETGQYTRRQIGQRFLADILELTPPATSAPQGDYILKASLQQITEEEVKRSYQKNLIPEPTRHKVAFKEIKATPPEVGVKRLVSIVGILRKEDRDNILLGSVDAAQQPTLRTWLQTGQDENLLLSLFPNQQDRKDFLQDFQSLDRIYQDWFTQQAISEPINLNALSPQPEKNLIDFPEPDNCTLAWTGSFSAAEIEAIAALNADDNFKNTLDSLIKAAVNASETDVTVAAAYLGLDQVPTGVKGKIAFSTNNSSSRYTGLTWSGLLFDQQEQILKRWAQIPTFAEAINALLAEYEQTVIPKTVTPPRPLPEELPDILPNRLQIATNQLTWIGPAPTDEQRSPLNNLEADEDFLNALKQLLGAIDAQKNVSMEPEKRRPQQQDLPEIVRNQLRIGSNKLTWLNPTPTSEQRFVLSRLSGDDEFLNAIRRLLDVIESNWSVDLRPEVEQPPIFEIPQSIRNQLQIDTNQLTWISPAPDSEQRTALENLDTNPEFVEAITRLLNAIDAGKSVNMAPEVRRPQQNQLAEVIRNQLQIGSNQLIWKGPAPNNQQRSTLTSLSGDKDFLDALKRLLAAIDATHTVTLRPRARRPRQNDVPGNLDSQLRIQPTKVEWSGRLHNAEQLQALEGLTGDEPFTTAIQAIVQQLKTQQVEITFDLAVRPQPKDLPDILRDKLLIGRAQIRYHGLMTVKEAHALQTVYQLEPDKQAIARLYDSAFNKGLRGKTLEIRARRGSAAPRNNSFESKSL